MHERRCSTHKCKGLRADRPETGRGHRLLQATLGYSRLDRSGIPYGATAAAVAAAAAAAAVHAAAHASAAAGME